ncbi:O-methyltransferase [Aspergillus nomiae NRRL 13137]|uniref:O-methyltransferase n=1 Tax=Aspergillus nomiae NRRL (strain ATCC 15546 / NRRL 13137 / CBS 260.88 / M93) TaxID=1509407 RepID=A0A0L1IKW4_ASPN3|nr:O-methyltransferase [Aspergillus nomiae NRRL 13137]KNG80147.1 O-methyltransferase [Aspergillus nomiae NRRL 13137]
MVITDEAVAETATTGATPSPGDGIAAAPSAPSQVLRLLREINSYSEACINGQKEARFKLVNAAESFVHALETPSETMMRHCVAQCTAYASVEACILLGVFSLLASSDDPKPARDLAEATGADEQLLGRLLKDLAAMGVFTEAGPDEYYRNGLSTAMCMKQYSDVWLFIQFNNLMSTYHQGRPSCIEEGFYPVHDNLIQGARDGKNGVFLVDPGAPGRLVLQDLPTVLDDIVTLDLSIERMAHNFFAVQPVKGARAYSLHSVLHNWNDEDCQTILSRLVASMAPGYSKILINEIDIPKTGAHWEATAMDILITVHLAAGVRTEQQWHQRIESVGLKVAKIWHRVGSVASLIECELA